MEQSSNNDLREFLIDRVLKNFSSIFDQKSEERLARLRREKIEIPVIYIGTATCGIISGADKTLKSVKKYIQEKGIEADIVEVGCSGLCAAEPIVDIQLPGKTRLSFKQVTAEKVEDILTSAFHYTVDKNSIIGQYRFKSHEDWPAIPHIDQLPFFGLQRRNLLKNAGLISPFSISDYLCRGGYKSLYKTVLNYTAEKVCEIVEQSELKGRGGAGFLTGKKWQVALHTASDQKFLICNADESDPGAFMNRAIIEADPHRVIEGISIAAYAIGASKAFIYIRADHERPVTVLENALQQAKEWGLIGDNIFGSGFNLSIQIRKGAGAFVCGEETALISSLEGSRGTPKTKPPFPAETGFLGHPTIVNNVETLANIPSILENGPSWFKTIGLKEDKGTKLISISGHIVNTGFVEIPMGTIISDIIYKIAGGIRNGGTLKAVQLGGPSGVCILPKDISTEIGFKSLSEIGAGMGLGGLIVLDETTCMVNLSRYFMEFLQNESCGKCIPCREGTKRMLEILDTITRRPRESQSHDTLERFKGVVQLETLAEIIKDTSLCGLGQKASNPLLSSIKWFRHEYEEHIFDRKCTAGVCHDLRTFYIDPEVCNGCNVCQKKCPESAIIGTLKMPHFVIEDKCTGCGICFDSCKFNAIYIK